MGLGAGVDHQFVGTGFGDRLRTILGALVVVEAQAHLGRHRHVSRHGTAHRRHDAADQFGFVQQHRAAAALVHRLGRAAEIEVHAERAQAREPRRVLGQTGRVGPQQLRPHRHARTGTPPMQQFGHHPQERALGQQGLGDADELAHAAVDATGAREHVAQGRVEQAFHGREQQGHGWVEGVGGRGR
ncbi:hypothetical protein D9M68_735990 [compost metagenome]